MTVYFEDVAKGDELPELVKEPISHIQLVRYSGACGDFNPIHTVPQMAEMVGLPGIIAHGMLIMAYAGQLITDWAGTGTLKQFKVRFSGMTLPGEYLICAGRVTAVDEDTGQVRGRLTVKGRDDDSLKLKGDFTVELPRK